MEIMQVQDELVVTRRVDGLQTMSLRVLVDQKGALSVAVDPVGAHPGNWVFTISGSAARYALDDPKVTTDLTIGGIIDHWDDGGRKAEGSTNKAGQDQTDAQRSAGTHKAA
ncbi:MULTISPECIES: carboxysome peptide B [unclassified Thioalkalivibrio]|uniref:carboxysome peptide B n=1 Tax=unclassified Thioalkalivibrio TaxID=2621013 RepID=UPI00037BAE04|nr:MULTISPECIES: carboxysome peptide B [unclassified Thioalkalivibrio]